MRRGCTRRNPVRPELRRRCGAWTADGGDACGARRWPGGRAYGARAETLTGLSGLGDLILTCASAQSRNFSLGIALGKGEKPALASEGAKLAEGAFTASALIEMAAECGIDMPIAAA